MHRVLPALVAAHHSTRREDNDASDGAQPARDMAAVLHHRVTTWHEHTAASSGHRAGH